MFCIWTTGSSPIRERLCVGATSLYVAAHKGHVAVIEKLIAAGADVDKARTDDGSTPLFIAAQNDHTSDPEM